MSTPRLTFYRNTGMEIVKVRRATCPEGYTRNPDGETDIAIPEITITMQQSVITAPQAIIRDGKQFIDSEATKKSETALKEKVVALEQQIATLKAEAIAKDKFKADDREIVQSRVFAKTNSGINEEVYYDLKRRWQGASERIKAVEERNAQLEDHIKELQVRLGNVACDMESYHIHSTAVASIAKGALAKLETMTRHIDITMPEPYKESVVAFVLDHRSRLDKSEAKNQIGHLRTKHKLNAMDNTSARFDHLPIKEESDTTPEYELNNGMTAERYNDLESGQAK